MKFHLGQVVMYAPGSQREMPVQVVNLPEPDAFSLTLNGELYDVQGTGSRFRVTHKSLRALTDEEKQ